MAERVALLDVNGGHMEWLREDDARRLVLAGKVEVLGARQRIRAVRVVAGATFTADERLVVDVKSGPARRHYSHNRETADNPAGVWTMVRIPKSQRKFFVPRECQAA